jgi:VanZ family protein
MKKPLAYSALFFYCILIFWLSDQSNLPAPDYFQNEDKLHHLIAYFVMGLFAWRFFLMLIPRRELIWIATVFFCSVYGISDEWHQSFVIGRNSDAIDWLADTTGGLLAGLICYFYHKKSSTEKAIQQYR